MKKILLNSISILILSFICMSNLYAQKASYNLGMQNITFTVAYTKIDGTRDGFEINAQYMLSATSNIAYSDEYMDKTLSNLDDKFRDNLEYVLNNTGVLPGGNFKRDVYEEKVKANITKFLTDLFDETVYNENIGDIKTDFDLMVTATKIF